LAREFLDALEQKTLAARVARLVFESNLAAVDQPADGDMVAFIRKHVYQPSYSKIL
jgi:hypothetical protein